MATEASTPCGGAGILSALAASMLANSTLAKTLLIASCLVGAPLQRGCAETISNALSLAYSGNPDLNQQRAATRATDEGVARANAGFRPQVVGTGSFGYNNQRESLVGNGAAGFDLSGTGVGTTGVNGNGFANGNTLPRQAALTVTQNIFNGNRTVNGVRQAESQVFEGREQTRTTEQNTLQNGATAYMNVLRDTAILDLDKNDIIVLEEQLRETRRLAVGEVTITDMAQADASLASARSTYFTAQANLLISIGGDTYASIRQAKELLAQARLQADLQRTIVRANVVPNWGCSSPPRRRSGHPGRR